MQSSQIAVIDDGQMLDDLPVESIANIFNFLDKKSLMVVALLSKNMRSLALHQFAILWSEEFVKTHTIPPELLNRLKKNMDEETLFAFYSKYKPRIVQGLQQIHLRMNRSKDEGTIEFSWAINLRRFIDEAENKLVVMACCSNVPQYAIQLVTIKNVRDCLAVAVFAGSYEVCTAIIYRYPHCLMNLTQQAILASDFESFSFWLDRLSEAKINIRRISFCGIGDYFQHASPEFLEKLLEQYQNGKWEDILENQFRNYLAYSGRKFEGKAAVEIWLKRLKILALLSSKNASSIATAFESIEVNTQEDNIFVMDALTSVIEFGNIGLLKIFTRILGGDENVRQLHCQEELLRAAACVATTGNFAMVQPVMDLTQEGDLGLIEEEILRSADLGLARAFFENTAFYSTGFIPSERNILIAIFSGNIALLEYLFSKLNNRSPEEIIPENALSFIGLDHTHSGEMFRYIFKIKKVPLTKKILRGVVMRHKVGSQVLPEIVQLVSTGEAEFKDLEVKRFFLKECIERSMMFNDPSLVKYAIEVDSDTLQLLSFQEIGKAGRWNAIELLAYFMEELKLAWSMRAYLLHEDFSLAYHHLETLFYLLKVAIRQKHFCLIDIEQLSLLSEKLLSAEIYTGLDYLCKQALVRMYGAIYQVIAELQNETPNSVAILSLLRAACGEDKEAASSLIWPEFFYETIKCIITYPEKFELDNNQAQLLLSLVNSNVVTVQEGMQREGRKENFAYVFIHKQNVLEDFKKWEREFNLSHSSISENTSTTFGSRKRKRSLTPPPIAEVPSITHHPH